jgi:hypothetical protein
MASEEEKGTENSCWANFIKRLPGGDYIAVKKKLVHSRSLSGGCAASLMCCDLHTKIQVKLGSHEQSKNGSVFCIGPIFWANAMEKNRTER